MHSKVGALNWCWRELRVGKCCKNRAFERVVLVGGQLSSSLFRAGLGLISKLAMKFSGASGDYYGFRTQIQAHLEDGNLALDSSRALQFLLKSTKRRHAGFNQELSHDQGQVSGFTASSGFVAGEGLRLWGCRIS